MLELVVSVYSFFSLIPASARGGIVQALWRHLLVIIIWALLRLGAFIVFPEKVKTILTNNAQPHDGKIDRRFGRREALKVI